MKIILLHGALGCSSDFSTLGIALENLGLKSETLEFSGHGATSFSQDFTISTFAEELYTYLEKQDPKSTLLFGYSMGGYAILEALSNYKALNFPFITLATKWQWTEEVAAKEQVACSKFFLMEKAPAFYEGLQRKHTDADTLLEKTAALLHSLGSATKPNIQAIASKALILRGALDKMVNQQESLELKDLIPNARYEELPATKHPLDTVDTNLLAAKINDFITELV
jgi:pimeloyl-ACP methyl ester carboxylesterase